MRFDATARVRHSLAFVILLAALFAAAPSFAMVELATERVVVDFDPDRVPRAIADRALEDAESHLDAILAMLGETYAPADLVRITLHGPADHENPTHYPRVDQEGRVHLFQFGPNADSHLSPLAHELVHALRNPHVKAWYGFVEEGFASWMSLRVAPDRAGFPFFGHPVDVVAGQWLGGEEDIPLHAIRLLHGQLNLSCRLQTYSLRTSFFDDLARRHGDERVVAFAHDVARTGRIDFDAAFGASFAELAEAWHSDLLARFQEDPQSAARARAYREAPELRGFPVCVRENDGPWAPRASTARRER